MKATIAIACSGLGYIRRGLETFTEDLFHLLQQSNEFQKVLLKGAGKKTFNEIPIWHLRRHSFAAKIIGRFVSKHPFYVQNVTFAVGMIPFLLKKKPVVIYIGEPVLYRCLQLWRRWSGQKFTMIFFTGGQNIPISFDPEDVLHHVTNELVAKADLMGIPTNNQFILPHFLHLSQNFQLPDVEKKMLLRRKLGLPLDSFVILSVGALDYSVKRMTYVIEEVSSLPESSHFLVLLGEREQETESILKYAHEKLPAGNFKIVTVAREEVKKYYQTADVFVLASLKEGFGLAYLEALAAGLPVLTHDHATARFVLQDYGYFADLTQHNALIKLLLSLSKNNDSTLPDSRYQFVYKNYSWDILKEKYLKMFHQGLRQRLH